MRTIQHFSLALGILVLAPAALPAATFYVGNNGVDAPGCGVTKTDPCRSLGEAIGLAADGDKIVVGPGRYGDIDGDGVFEPANGEEDGEPGAGCFCMVRIDKRLTVTSSAGAAATVLDGGGIAALNVVQIAADDVVFGKKKKGFTVTGAGFSGLEIVGGAARARVDGNIATANNNDGFFFRFGGDEHEFRGNLATQNGSSGFDFSGSGHTLKANAATLNGEEGFLSFGSDNALVNNLAAHNAEQGYAIAGPNHELKGSSAIGNGLAGFHFAPAGLGSTITKGNVFGNWAEGGTADNCGVINDTGPALDATQLFWGVATGPGPDPADTICLDPVNTAPVLTKEARVKAKIQP